MNNMNAGAQNGANPNNIQPPQPGAPVPPGQPVQPGQQGFIGPQLPQPPQGLNGAAVNPQNPQLLQALLQLANGPAQPQNGPQFVHDRKYGSRTSWTSFTGVHKPLELITKINQFKACLNNNAMPNVIEDLLRVCDLIFLIVIF